MTVAELIEILKAMPQELEVQYHDNEEGLCDVHPYVFEYNEPPRFTDGTRKGLLDWSKPVELKRIVRL